MQTHKEALQHFETDTINGDGAMINGIYYFVIPEEEKLRISNVLRKSLDLETISELQHIETKETQSTVDIQKNAPQQSSPVQEKEDTYVEPNVTPNYNYNYNNNNNYNNSNSNNNAEENDATPSTPSSAVDTSAATPVAPATRAPEVTAAPEQPQTQVPATQAAPVTQEPVKPTQPTKNQNP